MVANDFFHVNNNAVFRSCVLFRRKKRIECCIVLDRFLRLSMRYLDSFVLYLVPDLFGFLILVLVLWKCTFWYIETELQIGVVVSVAWFILYVLYTIWTYTFECVPYSKCSWLIHIEFVFLRLMLPDFFRNSRLYSCGWIPISTCHVDIMLIDNRGKEIYVFLEAFRD